MQIERRQHAVDQRAERRSFQTRGFIVATVVGFVDRRRCALCEAFDVVCGRRQLAPTVVKTSNAVAKPASGAIGRNDRTVRASIVGDSLSARSINFGQFGRRARFFDVARLRAEWSS